MATGLTPTGRLRDEHQVILRVLDVLDRLVRRGEAGDWDFDALDECVAFFRLFADACHHGKEEDLLFPELQSRGMPREQGPIAVMLFEHQQGRALVKRMAEALPGARRDDEDAIRQLGNAARGYLQLLRGHINKEDHVLFNMADQLVDRPACERLCRDYDVVCARRFEGRSKEELERLASELENRHGAR